MKRLVLYKGSPGVQLLTFRPNTNEEPALAAEFLSRHTHLSVMGSTLVDQRLDYHLPCCCDVRATQDEITFKAYLEGNILIDEKVDEVSLHEDDCQYILSIKKGLEWEVQPC